MLKQAGECHAAGQHDLALKMYHDARTRWMEMCLQEGITPSGNLYPEQNKIKITGHTVVKSRSHSSSSQWDSTDLA
eukprot:348174-Pyramimonas_sp.AAC.1